MRWSLQGWLGAWARKATLGLAWLLLAVAGPAAAAETALVLRDAMETIEAEKYARVWVDPAGSALIEEVASPRGLARFQPAHPGQIHALGEKSALWLHLRLVRPPSTRQNWLLEIPMPVLDLATVYQPIGPGWRIESSGDNLAVAEWPESGRTPYFRIDLPPEQPRDIFVRIRHTTAANFPLLLATETAHDHRIQVEYLGLGMTFGALLLLIAACLAQSWVYRDRIYAWYALSATVTALAVAAYTGVAAHLLWPGFGALSDAPQAMLSYLAAAAALLFVRSLIGVPPRYKLADRLIYALGIAGLLLPAIHPFIPKTFSLTLLGAYAVLATLVNVAMSMTAWRRGDVVGMWVFAAYVPITLAVGMGVVRIFGWLPVSFVTQYAIVVAMALEVPLLLVALSIRSRERHGAQIREQALSTQDALTGLLAPHLFHDRLQQVVARHKRDQESAAVIYIDLVNYQRIKEVFGSAVAEQSLLRTVIKLRRLLRDVDTVSRVGEARFGVILEGARSRTAVTDRAARLIAAGLMPLQGLKPEVTLQFHISAVLLDERPMEPAEINDALATLLARMSPRTRRPIRFVAPLDTQPAALGSDSSLLADELGRVQAAG